jgi:hypothetical protein
MAPTRECEELRLRLSQCRNLLTNLQAAYERDQLTIETASVRADFRHAIMLLMWIAFYARSAIDFRLFRKLVAIESSFTYLLIMR